MESYRFIVNPPKVAVAAVSLYVPATFFMVAAWVSFFLLHPDMMKTISVAPAITNNKVFFIHTGLR